MYVITWSINNIFRAWYDIATIKSEIYRHNLKAFLPYLSPWSWDLGTWKLRDDLWKLLYFVQFNYLEWDEWLPNGLVFLQATKSHVLSKCLAVRTRGKQKEISSPKTIFLSKQKQFHLKDCKINWRLKTLPVCAWSVEWCRTLPREPGGSAPSPLHCNCQTTSRTAASCWRCCICSAGHACKTVNPFRCKLSKISAFDIISNTRYKGSKVDVSEGLLSNDNP